MTTIHPTAVVEKDVQLAQDVVIGPYCVIGD
ncbi:MAG: acyl-[acyl-carrier-protein]--UDP-N-acetylglucosamine O-acyltransferase, partial [Planctomycetes bacterium]|nr:acyl-[acyl-carrier-protein]--UDP-N-acetylglucosamine O-acyltransferase [Planctomycetota bacterium]